MSAAATLAPRREPGGKTCGLKRVHRGRACEPGEVPLAQLAREIDRGYRYFLAVRGLPNPYDRSPWDAPAAPRRTTPGGDALRALAQAYLGIERPPRGTLKELARVHGVVYRSLARTVHDVRHGRRHRRAAA